METGLVGGIGVCSAHKYRLSAVLAHSEAWTATLAAHAKQEGWGAQVRQLTSLALARGSFDCFAQLQIVKRQGESKVPRAGSRI